MQIKKITFIGLGAMGTPMAGFLLKAGYDVKGFDLMKKRMSNLASLGLKPTKSPKDYLQTLHCFNRGIVGGI